MTNHFLPKGTFTQYTMAIHNKVPGDPVIGNELVYDI